MFIINRLKLKKSQGRATVLCILIIISIFCQTVGNSFGAGFQIAANEGDILMYKMTFGNETTYTKYEINKTVENSNSFIIYYNGYVAEDLTEFNETDIDVAYSNATLTGDISEDLFASERILTLILPIGTNFTDSESELQDYFYEMEEDITIVFSIGPSGYSLNIAFYIRIIILVKIVEITFYYSTTGVLLQEDFYFKDPTSTTEANGKIEIIPEYSTILGADENPYNPANVPGLDSTGDDQFDDLKKIQFDTKGIIYIILASLGFSGLVVLSVYLIKRRRNN